MKKRRGLIGILCFTTLGWVWPASGQAQSVTPGLSWKPPAEFTVKRGPLGQWRAEDEEGNEYQVKTQGVAGMGFPPGSRWNRYEIVDSDGETHTLEPFSELLTPCEGVNTCTTDDDWEGENNE